MSRKVDRSAVSDRLAYYRQKFQSLNTGQHQGRPRPHKPVMLLAVLSLADCGALLKNHIVYDTELLEQFRQLFDVVRRPTDQCKPQYPFFHLKSEGFWHLHACPGEEAHMEAMNATRVTWMTTVISHISLDEELFELIAAPITREQLRGALIDRYFPEHRVAILDLCRKEQDVGRIREEWRSHEYRTDNKNSDENDQPARSIAFARTVREAYDYRCAACGVRFRYNDVVLIDAAHLVPFSETHDNSPQNGMALCKNHHWLMDQCMIAPGPGSGRDYSKPKWYVKKDLDNRIEGQRELLELKGKRVILPSDTRLYPKKEALDRRMEMMKEDRVA